MEKEEAPSRAKRLVEKNDILYQMVRPYQQNNLYFSFNDELDYVASTGYAQIRTFYHNNSMYVYHLMHTKKFLDKVLERCTGTSYPAINSEDLSNISIKISKNINEQEKIANFLSSVDKKISLTEEKLELFREYKKGVMQKIFSQELRFKDSDGNDYPEWEEKKLEDIVNINKGKQLNKELLEKQGEYPVINGGILPSGYTDKYNTLSNTITISEGGNSCGYVNFIKNNFWAGGHCYTLNKKIEINYKYLYQLLKFNEVNIMDLRVGSGLPNIQKSAINNYKINISTTLEEQQKISDFLSSIDSKIESIEKELERLKEFKKGLLQQMFV
nr:restriction endonuclease subunit S [Fusobacterium hominis]